MSILLDEQQFRMKSDDSLTRLERALEKAAARYEFDVDRHEGALTVEFEDPPARFVVSPNAPVRQIWVSARVQSFKLDWSDAAGDFVLPADGRSLQQLLADVIGQQLGEPVSL
jgi:iron donor protein CyaY